MKKYIRTSLGSLKKVAFHHLRKALPKRSHKKYANAAQALLGVALLRGGRTEISGPGEPPSILWTFRDSRQVKIIEEQPDMPRTNEVAVYFYNENGKKIGQGTSLKNDSKHALVHGYPHNLAWKDLFEMYSRPLEVEKSAPKRELSMH